MPSFQPMVPGTTVAWTAHANSSVPAFASGEIVGIVCCYYSDVFDYKYVSAYLDEQFLQFTGLGFVSLGPFHCA